MKKIFFLSILLVLIYGCNKDEIDNKGVSINLIERDDPNIFSKSVILYNQDDYLIKTPLDTFLLGYPFLWYGYGDMKTKAINDGQTNDVLNVSDYMKYNGDSIYTLAYYLENGSCLVREYKSNKIIFKIQVETYMEGEPMASTGGRRFYINNNLFLETVDLISK
jgi:hypothetical protein